MVQWVILTHHIADFRRSGHQGAIHAPKTVFGPLEGFFRIKINAANSLLYIEIDKKAVIYKINHNLWSFGTLLAT
jgi:hypothetical protein